ncbi:hypothetical protein GCM10025882_24320 [Acinetobacter gyllenbergii]|nr:hypothetical protein F987_00028 [Acinetobacter gyllenbergii NIPH 230]GMA12007.1 hypothetical protein GCM10025882_24320 [Acinetobacter gyllenbergii]
MIGEYSADGVPLVEYVWMGDKPVAAIYGSGATSKTYWIVTDAQNTPRRLIDAADASTTVWAWDSTAFGVGVPSVQTVKFNLRFPGQYYDELTKQHYNHNRYYNPALGRYVEPDPIGLEGGLNPYIYANGNPINSVDPNGLDCIGGKCSSSFEQTMYDWWPGYKFGTGLYNSFYEGSYQMRGAELFDGGLSFLGALGRIGYVLEVKNIGNVVKTAEEAVALRNAIKLEYRGPLAKPLGNWHISSYEQLSKIKTSEEIIEGSMRTNKYYTNIIIGNGFFGEVRNTYDNLNRHPTNKDPNKK